MTVETPVRGLSARDLAERAGRPVPTPEQEAVIAAAPGPSAIVAGAGSGKTDTMANRVVWLVANGHLTPSEVLGLTFTRKAAAELTVRIRERLRAALRGPDGGIDPRWVDVLAEDCTVLTYDAYARRLVTEHGLREGVEPTVRLAQDAARWLVARDTVLATDQPIEDIGLAVSTVIARLATISAEMAGHLRTPAEVTAFGTRLVDEIEAVPVVGRREKYAATLNRLAVTRSRSLLMPLVDRFEQAKVEREMMDFGDILRVAHALATRHPEVAALERERYRVVLLDEYQDTSSAQAALLHALYGGHAVTAVGDPCQAIYGFRGASENTLRAFRTDFAAGEPMPRFHLSTSFRNDAAILHVANAVSEPLRAAGVDVAVLRPRPDAEGGSVTVSVPADVADEAVRIVDRIERLREDRAGATIGILARRRSDWARIVELMRERRIPYDVTGLAGLLDEPEIVDVVETMRVLVDPAAGAALLRLLTGPRWQIGPRDLRALSDWSARLAAAMTPGRPDGVPDGAREPDEDQVDTRSLVEALDAVQDAPDRGFSRAGLARMRRLSGELRRLRSGVGQPLPDLVAQVERELMLDVEISTRDFLGARTPRAQLDRFVDVATQFAASSGSDSVVAFLAYLDAARNEENGLPMAQSDLEVAAPGERVQVLTMHAAKGLEWDVVFLPGLVDNANRQLVKESGGWLKHLPKLPYPLRGDAAQLPVFDPTGCADQKELNSCITTFDADCKKHGLAEQRRLFYVAVTRARHELHLSGYRWDTTVKPFAPHVFLQEVIDRLAGQSGWAPDVWVEAPLEDETNPLTSRSREIVWPQDPLGARRAATLDGARLVRAAAGPAQLSLLDTVPPGAVSSGASSAAVPSGASSAAVSSGAVPSGTVPPDAMPTEGSTVGRDDERVAVWRRDTALLLAERERRARRGPVDVRLPVRLSASQLVALARDPHELAVQLRRPVPRGPAPAARRGTRFHAWLEQRFAATTLLDLDDLPGSGDADLDLSESFDDLRSAFERSEWAQRVPIDVEVPFDLTVAGVPLRGRMDAVFAWEADDTADFDVIDWKTGAKPGPAELRSGELQLAVYRLAWAALTGLPVGRVRAGFHYVSTGETYRPADDDPAATLARLLGSVSASDPVAAQPPLPRNRPPGD